MIITVLFMTAIWAVLTRDASIANLILGAFLGTALLRLAGRRGASLQLGLRRLPSAISLALFFLWEMLLSNLRMLALVLGPKHKIRPALIAVPIEIESEAELGLLADLVTLTPGTLSVDVSDDRKELWVHCIDATKPEQIRREIGQDLAARVRRVFR